MFSGTAWQAQKKPSRSEAVAGHPLDRLKWALRRTIDGTLYGAAVDRRALRQ